MIKYGGVGMHNVRGGSPGVCATPLIDERIDRVSQEPLIEIFTCSSHWLSPQRGLRALNLLASCMHGARHSVNVAPLMEGRGVSRVARHDVRLPSVKSSSRCGVVITCTQRSSLRRIDVTPVRDGCCLEAGAWWGVIVVSVKRSTPRRVNMAPVGDRRCVERGEGQRVEGTRVERGVC